jgi:hypothetical protein
VAVLSNVFVGRFKEIRGEGGGGVEGRGVLLYVYWYARTPGASSRFLGLGWLTGDLARLVERSIILWP